MPRLARGFGRSPAPSHITKNGSRYSSGASDPFPVFWGRTRVRVRAVLNLCENRLCLQQRFAIRKSPRAQRLPASPSVRCDRRTPSYEEAACSRREDQDEEAPQRKETAGASSLDPHPTSPRTRWRSQNASSTQTSIDAKLVSMPCLRRINYGKRRSPGTSTSSGGRSAASMPGWE
jgi:hypothetical protein